MAYQDPYSQHPGRLQSHDHYNEATSDYNPYSTTRPAHETYDQGEIGPSYDGYGNAYRDEPQYDREYPPRRGQSQRTFTGGPLAAHSDTPQLGTSASKESEFDVGGTEGITTSHGKRTARALRNYRYDHQGNLWTKGGRGRCIGRFCCCTLMIGLLLFISIILALALWIRPPNITVGGVETVTKSGSPIQLLQDGITIDLGVNITVDNPNYFAVNFKQIKAEIIYPINNTNIGEGIAKDVVFKSNSQTNWTFPFAINYRTNLDPQSRTLVDLAQKCGINGSKSNISVNYKITQLGLRILFITVSPVVTNTFSFMCPIDASDIEPLLKSTGIGGGLLGGSG
ncbi:hypothetical protein BDZ94DRAFT_360972 [Collybia nuda]|uniref:Late embryogenesis abundant protein LEA-2 subgroup domain-containing protein n=1 Tax=Collybia nuda TaxID=64659 RepID=A0A9P5YHM6_9AGAR|nr:hypothetical protein BDZ94DRAFT_360972 [Collybia nuda]